MAMFPRLLAVTGWLCVCRPCAGRSAEKPSKVEVVVAQHSEDLSWTAEHERPGVQFTVYSKGEKPPFGSTVLPNVGREAHTYLYHIVRHFDALADWTVFTQGARPSWGYQGGGEISGHLSDTVEFADYLQPYPDGRDSFFVLSAASQFPSAMQTNRLGFAIGDLKENATGKSLCPPLEADGWTPWWWDQAHPQLWGKASDLTMLQFYHRFIAGDDYTDEPLTLAFAQGARFAVSRERIHARPREYYAAILQQLSHSAMPIEGYWMEAAWYDAFHPEALQSKHAACTLPAVPPQQGALTIPAMQAEVLRRAKESGLLDDQSGKASPVRMLSGYYTTTQGPSWAAPSCPRPLALLMAAVLAILGATAPSHTV